MRGAKPPSEQTSVRGWSVSAKPCVLEFGMGVDVHGGDGTKAACRAVSDAIRHSSLPLYDQLRLLEELSMVDLIARGRDHSAVGRDIVPHELPYVKLHLLAAHDIQRE